VARVEVALEVAEIGLALADIGTEAAAGVAGVANIETITIRDIGYAARLIRPEAKIRGKKRRKATKEKEIKELVDTTELIPEERLAEREKENQNVEKLMKKKSTKGKRANTSEKPCSRPPRRL